MVVFASEDVASPPALVVANAVLELIETVGYPECQEKIGCRSCIPLNCKKDRQAYDGFMSALSPVENLEIFQFH